jgi:hypothetical protein
MNLWFIMLFLLCITEEATMMKELSIYFVSATGNTRRAVGIVRDTLAAERVAVEFYRILQGTAGIIARGESDILVAFPAMGFGLPHIVLKRLKRFPG